MNKSRRIFIEKEAESVRATCNISDYGFTNIFEAVKRIGYRVIRYPIGENSFLGMAQCRNNDKIIFTNSSQILSREIFTIAHELGHHQLKHINDTDNTLIKDNDFSSKGDLEVEANYFAACLLIPSDQISKFIRLELNDKSSMFWTGLDIARIQNAFNVSYSMALIRLNYLKYLSTSEKERLENEKIESSATQLLRAIDGNCNLCAPTKLKQIPAEYLEWAIWNYNEKLIPRESLKKALDYVDLDIDFVIDEDEKIDEEENDENFLKFIKGEDF